MPPPRLSWVAEGSSGPVCGEIKLGRLATHGNLSGLQSAVFIIFVMMIKFDLPINKFFDSENPLAFVKFGANISVPVLELGFLKGVDEPEGKLNARVADKISKIRRRALPYLPGSPLAAGAWTLRISCRAAGALGHARKWPVFCSSALEPESFV